MWSKHSVALILATSLETLAFLPTSNPAYSLTHDFSGANVFEKFQFFSEADPTNGHVQYVDAQTANNTALAGFMPELAGNSSNAAAPFYLGVDDTMPGGSIGRLSVRMNSIAKFGHALVIADILHMPAPVCGTWPAFWLLGSGADWPNAGEIDILEGVNDDAFARYTLHTSPGVVTANHTGVDQTGSLITPNCDVNAPDQLRNAGCSVVDAPGSGSYGQSFNDNKGGVFATLIDSGGVRIWFFSRDSIPADVTSGSPNPPPRDAKDANTTGESTSSSWPLPNARFDSPENASDTFDTHFKDLQIVINIAFCGDWAGRAWVEGESCRALAPTCEEYVSGHPEAFTDVYWAFNSIKVFEPTNGMDGTTFDNGTMSKTDDSLKKRKASFTKRDEM